LSTLATRRVHDGFLRSAADFPQRPALEVEGRSFTYAELKDRATALAQVLSAGTPSEGPALTAVFAHRSLTAFVGVLGALLRGHGYVPLNPRLPAARNATMLAIAGCRAVVVDSSAAAQLEGVLADVDRDLLLVFPDESDVEEERRRWPGHTVVGARELEAAAGTWQPAGVDEDGLAYLLFTSGSTGVPKAVMVSHDNVLHFVDRMLDRFGITHEDRLSQTFDMTFDVSVFDMFVGWDRGACVCCPSADTVVKPGNFIRESELTVWFSVPSIALLMKRFGMLRPDLYPRLRWSLFAGEPLPTEVARLWSEAAPNSVVENLYGPTEVTVICTGYRWDPQRSPEESEFGVVPIGWPLPGLDALVADQDLREVPEGAEGELLVAGPQVTRGYLNEPERTAAAFVVPPGRRQLFYRTGDLVRNPREGGPITYLGRIDHQVKINGVRVELGEIEAHLRTASGVEEVVALGWPRSESSALAITAFVCAAGLDTDAIRARMASQLPEYMIPRTIHLIPELPLNTNGKIDRKALLAILEQR
jgi:amino acid adenylation domain-containing protein